MTIKKMSKNKKKLERKIAKLLKQFGLSSGLNVNYVEVMVKGKVEIGVSFRENY